MVKRNKAAIAGNDRYERANFKGVATKTSSHKEELQCEDNDATKPKNVDFPSALYPPSRPESQLRKRKLVPDSGDNQAQQYTNLQSAKDKTRPTRNTGSLFAPTPSSYATATIEELLSDLARSQANAQPFSRRTEITDSQTSAPKSEAQPKVNKSTIENNEDDDWKLVCCDNRAQSHFMFECDLCGGWEHALCTNYYNRIWEGTHLCRSCDTPENRNQLEDKNKDVVVCRCGKTDRDIVKELRGEEDSEVEGPAADDSKAKKPRLGKFSTKKSKLQKSAKIEAKASTSKESLSTSTKPLLEETIITEPKATQREPTIACSGCGSHVHQKCFGLDGKLCEYHFWVLCDQCKRRLKLEPGQSFGGLQCACGDTNEADKRPRLTCWRCKLQFHIECLDEIDGSPLEPGHMLQCPVCIEHSQNKQPSKCCAAPNRWDK